MRNTGKISVSLPIAIIAASLIIGGAILLTSQKKDTGNPSLSPSSAPKEELKGAFSFEGNPALGNPEAPVTIFEYSDFQCPYCARHTLETFPELKKAYIDSGKVKLVFKNFPLPGHSFAKKAAEAAECAFEQNKFWIYKETLFENQQNLSLKDLKKYAQELGLNTEQFNSCLDSGKYVPAVEKDLQEGQVAGIDGTPSFFINGEKLGGAYPFASFQQIIDAKLQ